MINRGKKEWKRRQVAQTGRNRGNDHQSPEILTSHEQIRTRKLIPSVPGRKIRKVKRHRKFECGQGNLALGFRVRVTFGFGSCKARGDAANRLCTSQMRTDKKKTFIQPVGTYGRIPSDQQSEVTLSLWAQPQGDSWRPRETERQGAENVERRAPAGFGRSLTHGRPHLH
jgi:hypothetical protein